MSNYLFIFKFYFIFIFYIKNNINLYLINGIKSIEIIKFLKSASHS